MTDEKIIEKICALLNTREITDGISIMLSILASAILSSDAPKAMAECVVKELLRRIKDHSVPEGETVQ